MWPLAAVVAVGTFLRVLVIFSYRPAMWFAGDSFSYVGDAVETALDPIRPSGYSIFLVLLEPFHSLRLVAVVQHLIGLALVVGVYVLASWLGAPARLAALAALPTAVDTSFLYLEHALVSELLFLGLAGAALALLLWRPAGFGPIAGFLLGIAAVTRTVGEVLLVLAVLYLLSYRRWLVALATGAAFLVPVSGYAALFHLHHGQFAITQQTGFFLYGRVQAFAECAELDLTTEQRSLCDPRPPSQRPPLDYYLWNPSSPLYALPGPRQHDERVARGYALKAIEASPLSYAKVVGRDLALYVSPARPASVYRFTGTPQFLPAGWPTEVAARYQDGRSGATVVRHRSWLLTKGISVWRPLYGLALFLAVLGLWRGRDRRASFLLTGTVVAMLVAPALTVTWDLRYQVTTLPFLGLAAVLFTPRAGRGGGTPAAGQHAIPRQRSPRHPSSTALRSAGPSAFGRGTLEL